MNDASPEQTVLPPRARAAKRLETQTTLKSLKERKPNDLYMEKLIKV